MVSNPLFTLNGFDIKRLKKIYVELQIRNIAVDGMCNVDMTPLENFSIYKYPSSELSEYLSARSSSIPHSGEEFEAKLQETIEECKYPEYCNTLSIFKHQLFSAEVTDNTFGIYIRFIPRWGSPFTRDHAHPESEFGLQSSKYLKYDEETIKREMKREMENFSEKECKMYRKTLNMHLGTLTEIELPKLGLIKLIEDTANIWRFRHEELNQILRITHPDIQICHWVPLRYD